jgi:hypothetical protein
LDHRGIPIVHLCTPLVGGIEGEIERERESG